MRDTLPDDIVRKASALIAGTREKARLEAERSGVYDFWAAGGILAEYLDAIRGDAARSAAAARLVEEVARASGRRARQIYEFVDFARKFPQVPSRALLTWSHYRRLLRVPSLSARLYYVREASRHAWGIAELDVAVTRDAFIEAAAGPVAPVSAEDRKWLKPVRATLYAYRISHHEAAAGFVPVDLGFHQLADVALPSGALSPEPGSLVISRRGEDDSLPYSLEVAPGNARPYMYKARVVRVVDGDTLEVLVDHGFRVRSVKKLRLRGIDTPEMWTAAGKVVRAWVEEAVSAVPFVVVRTQRPDKYGRFLADVFYLPGEERVEEVAARGRYLNGELVRLGLAGIVRA